MFDPMIVLFVLFLMRVLLRKQWIAAAAAVASLDARCRSARPSAPAIDIPATALLEALEVLVLLRFGVPAVIVAGVVSTYLLDVPDHSRFFVVVRGRGRSAAGRLRIDRVVWIPHVAGGALGLGGRGSIAVTGILVCGDNHFIVRGPRPSHATALDLARHWS